MPTIRSKANNVKITKNDIIVYLEDGRVLSIPISYFPTLEKASEKERNNWRLIGRGVGIHWEDIDEDISINGLLGI